VTYNAYLSRNSFKITNNISNSVILNSNIGNASAVSRARR
jgi:hypothetical protein